MNGAARKRGWPLMSLGILLGGWVLMRAAVWDVPFDRDLPLTMTGLTEASSSSSSSPAPDRAAHLAPVPLPQPEQAMPGANGFPDLRDARRHPPVERPDFERRYDLGPVPRMPIARGAMRQAGVLMAHAAMLSSAYRHGAQPALYQPGAGPIAPEVAFAPDAAQRFATETAGPRWGMDIWALWRDDTTTPFTSGRPSYGRSQAGAVVRYRLAPSSGHAPQAYVRATRSLEGQAETQLAAGLSARPLPSVPIRLAAEARVSETDRGTEMRAAAYAVSELPPVTLPAGFEGQAYLAAGYVTGEFATPFADGQARITRAVSVSDNFRLEAGGGAWGGAQDDAHRIDVGPTAGMSFELGRARARVSADYRFRVAGDAEPSSGPALTLTAGF